MHISPVLWEFLVKWLTNSALFRRRPRRSRPKGRFLLLSDCDLGRGPGAGHPILVFGFSIAYREEKNPVATQIEGSTLLEATWTIIPLALFMVSFVWGALLYFRIYDPPTNAMNIYVVGKQWMWKAEHPGGQHEMDALHVPINRQVQLTMISQDVFHSFSIPAFRVKREVIPGRYSTVWFEATDPGQLSSLLHPVLRHPALADDWKNHRDEAGRLSSRGPRAAPAAPRSHRTASASTPASDATACHSGAADARGPNLAEVYGTKLQLTNGFCHCRRRLPRDTILNPSMHMTAGYAPIMPTYQGQVSEEGLIDLVEYIKKLNSNYRIQQTLTTTSRAAGASSSRLAS